jgi:DHA3 family macrolide efflux protein-like MFS transporter
MEKIMALPQIFQRDRLLKVFRYRPYRWFFLGHLLTWIGNSMQAIANSWLALLLTGSPSAVAYVFIASTLPGMLCSPFIGVIVDRFDRKWISTVSDTIQALLLLLLFVIGIRGQLQVWHLYVIAFCLSLGEVIYRPSSIGLLREEVPPEVLLYTNSYNGIARQAGGAIGAALGGLLIAFFSPYLVFGINAISFFCSALSTFHIRKGYKAPAKPSTKANLFHRFTHDMVDGWQYIRSRRDIILLYSILVITLSTLDVINVAIAIFVKNVLHNPVSVMGTMEAAFAIGSIVGNLTITSFAAAKGTHRTMTIGISAVALALLMLALSFNAPMAILSYLFLGGTLPVWLLYLTTIQKIVPDHFQGRVNATFQTFSSVISLLVFVGISYLVGVMNVRILYFIQFGLLLIPCILTYKYIFPQRAAKQLPAEAQETPS